MEKEAKQNQDMMNDLLDQLKSQQIQIETLKAIVANNNQTGVEKEIPLKTTIVVPKNEDAIIPKIPEPVKFFHIENNSPNISQQPKKEEPIKHFKLQKKKRVYRIDLIWIIKLYKN